MQEEINHRTPAIGSEVSFYAVRINSGLRVDVLVLQSTVTRRPSLCPRCGAFGSDLGPHANSSDMQGVITRAVRVCLLFVGGSGCSWNASPPSINN